MGRGWVAVRKVCVLHASGCSKQTRSFSENMREGGYPSNQDTREREGKKDKSKNLVEGESSEGEGEISESRRQSREKGGKIAYGGGRHGEKGDRPGGARWEDQESAKLGVPCCDRSLISMRSRAMVAC